MSDECQADGGKGGKADVARAGKCHMFHGPSAGPSVDGNSRYRDFLTIVVMTRKLHPIVPRATL